MMSDERKKTMWALPGLLLVGLVLLFFNKMAFSNLILARGDTFLYFYPYWQAAAEALGAGRVPLWNDSLFMGAPLLANSQVGFFYPLNWPVWLLLPTPYAVSASIIIHVLIAGTGAYLLAKRALSLDWQAALLTAVFFSLGGYFTAQVEHINQVQGLAWLPWLLWAVTPAARDKMGWQWALRRGTAVALFFALQLFAGHAQTTFISGAAAGVWVLADAGRLKIKEWGGGHLQSFDKLKTGSSIFNLFSHPVPLILGVLLALLLTAVQLLPTLELSGYSARQGALLPNEVLSFSLNPLLLGQALLPTYGQSLFTEYVAFLPITALVLAVVGAWQWRARPGVFPALALALLGLFLAFGVFNPLYWLLARLPGFDLFRVPARWLALYGLGMALLAGVGFQLLWERWRSFNKLPFDKLPFDKLPFDKLRGPSFILHPSSFILPLLLMVWYAAAGVLARFLPIGPEAPYEAPNFATLLLWLLEIVIVYLFVAGRRLVWQGDGRLPLAATDWGSPWRLGGLALAVLFLASRSLPYNHLTTPEAWFDLRPPAARLLIDDTVPPGRLLSLSNIFFDPGDQGEIASIYADQLDEAALYDYIVAIKQKEIIAPNLPLAYGLASVDGFDGGILPLAAYSQLMRLILPDGQTTTDGRLREHLTAVPAAKWLDLFNGRYLITDKTGDQWRQAGWRELDVFFDLAHPLEISAGQAESVAFVPPFPATALAALVEGEPGLLAVTTAEGDEWLLEPQLLESGMVWFNWPPPYVRPSDARQPVAPQSITFQATPDASWRVAAATLVNVLDDAFQPLTLGSYRLIHSGDVKIYENLDVMPRAFFAPVWQWQPDTAAALAVMAEADFDPRETAVLLGSGLSGQQTGEPGAAVIQHYEPERVVIRTENAADGLLLLTDAHYPGWQASVDGQPVPIEMADVLFKAVFVPAGEHEVVFTFKSGGYENGRYVSLAGLVLFLIALIASLWKAVTETLL